MLIIPAMLGAVLLLWFAVERILLWFWIRSIPIRIHVNGTRGKSSVTRYIAAALRASGRRTMAKITGVVPTIILPDGSEETIRRFGRPHMREQLRMIRKARTLKCDAIVLECMSINPSLQKLESIILRPHITVLTNILDDHREELGESESERIHGFLEGLPRNARIVAGTRPCASMVEREASRRGTKVLVARSMEPGVMKSYPVGTIAENVALAFEVCSQLHLQPDASSHAIHAEAERIAVDDRLITIRTAHTGITFVNGFAVNDVPSAVRFVDYWKRRVTGWENLVFVLNTRHDRPIRSKLFAKWCSTLRGDHHIILTGTHVPFTKRVLLRYGVAARNLHCWSWPEVQEPIASLTKIVRNNVLVIGLGNIAGDGFTLLEKLRQFAPGERP